jgi:hypothetical protein
VITQIESSGRFKALLQHLSELHDAKESDYARPEEGYSNIRASQEWGVKPWVGAMVRLNDKVRRLQQLAKRGTLTNEGARDSFKDIAVYALIAHILYDDDNA